MRCALSTLDLLAQSVRQSFIAANALILRPEPPGGRTSRAARRESAALDRGAQFIVKNVLGNRTTAIPLAMFQSSARYYLSGLKLDLPCYTVQKARFLRRRDEPVVLHAFAPTVWQRLFYVCHMYRVVIEADFDKAAISVIPASGEEAARFAGRRRGGPARWGWKFRLSPEQAAELMALPKTAIRPFYVRDRLGRIWRRLCAKLKPDSRRKAKR
jgi:hypothetical protein